jgi:hypothetical protein
MNIRSAFGFLRTSVVAFALAGSTLNAQQIPLPFYPNGTYDRSIPPPDSVLGFPLAQKPARYDAVVRYIALLAEKSPRVKLFKMGETYEQRNQYYLVVTSEENHGKLENIRQSIATLADPRSLSAQEAQRIIASVPAVIWIGYGIHGDELSSVDASLQVVYQLAAGTDSATMRIMNQLVVCIDPMENPDGRERFLGQIQQWNGEVVNSDVQSMAHGVWPWGRGNHYLFDLNRDWFYLTQRENQSRVPTVLSWNPQVLIDSHEMGSYDTYLFNPPRQPINPNISDTVKKWWKVFSADQAKAFDRYGWSYYTREWNDEWYPGYGSSYATYIDAVGILYEQAGTDGTIVKRPDGTTLTYRESVHHHIVSSIANLTTAADHRKELLQDFWTVRSKGPSAKKGEARCFYLVPGNNRARILRLVDVLLRQKIEVRVTEKPLRVSDAHDAWGSKPMAVTMPAGTFVVSLDQPHARLAKSILEFDPRMTTEALLEERKSLEKEKESMMYDVTAWSLPLSYNVEAYWSESQEISGSRLLTDLPEAKGSLRTARPQYGYLFDYSDDRALEAMAVLFTKGYTLRSARKPVEIEGTAFPRGSILARLNENPPSLVEDMQVLAEKVGITVQGMNTALSTSGPDLGGNDFVLLQQPRIAILAGPEISTTSAGSLWYLLDNKLRYRVSLLNSLQLNRIDLSKYNVLVLPSGGYKTLGKPGIEKLKSWVEAGGTLIGVGGGAAFVADSSTAMSDVRPRDQALKELNLYAKTLGWEQGALALKVDSMAVWAGKEATKDTARVEKGAAANEKALALEDERARLFMPRGAIMRVDLDAEHWLVFGAGNKVPALMFTSVAFLTKDPVQTPARFAGSKELRLSGLLWPEAAERWAKTAYATRERKGKGQIILFAGEPNFRACFLGTERLLLNALFLGPGFGTYHPVEW